MYSNAVFSTDVQTFLESGGYAKSTQDSYRYALETVRAWLDAQGLTLDDFTVQVYYRFVSAHQWSNNMIRMYASALRAFFQWRDKNRSHPLFQIKLPKDNALPGRALDERRLRDLLASFDTSTPIGWRDLAMAALLADTGLRASEICRVEMARLDMAGQRLVVMAKGQKASERVFSEDTKRFLEIWLAERDAIAKKGIKTVFVSIRGKRPGTAMTPSGLRCLYRTFGERSGVGMLSPHDMRRTMAMLLTEAGAPTRLVQVLGGWEDVRMVERYTRKLQPQQIEKFSPVKAVMETITIETPSALISDESGGGKP